MLFPLDVATIPNKLLKVLTDYYLIYYAWILLHNTSENFGSDLISSMLSNIRYAFYMSLSIKQIWEHEWTSLYNVSENMLSIGVYFHFNL